MKKTHYFGSTAYSWRAGETLDEVVRGLAKDAGSRSINYALKDRGGLECYTCRVLAPLSAPYEIRRCMPAGVECDEFAGFRITNSRGRRVPMESPQPAAAE